LKHFATNHMIGRNVLERTQPKNTLLCTDNHEIFHKMKLLM